MSPADHPASAMSSATKAILARVRQMVPPMLGSFHKGQLGRVGVIGGSEDYTGAPYFSAIASARLGCDMSHVICTPAAAAVIKTYSPNLMVHPLMRQSQQTDGEKAGGSKAIEDEAATVGRRIAEQLLPRLHVLVVGPGLGRDPLMQATVAHVIAAARKQELPLVLDADALLLVQSRPELVRGYPLVVLTPNVVEFGRLEKALVHGDDQAEAASTQQGGKHEDDSVHDQFRRALRLSQTLGGIHIIQKGEVDIIAGGTGEFGPYASDLAGGRKRSGGQGDTLTGSVATFLGWRKAYLDGLWDGARDEKLDERELVLLAAFGGSAITRESSRLAFEKRGRSLQASDLTDEVHTAFLNLFGEVDGAEEGAKL